MAAAKADEDVGIHAGVNKNRKCRDFLCIILFAVFWAGMFVVCSTAVKNGNLNNLILPSDYLGNLCGVKNNNTNPYYDQTNNPYLYYINPFDTVPTNGTSLNVNMTFICVPSCPTNTTIVYYNTPPPCRYDVQLAGVTDLGINTAYDICAPYVYQSVAVLHRCVPNSPILLASLNSTSTATIAAATGINVNSMITSGESTAAQAVSDLTSTWTVLLVCAFTAVFISIVWLHIAQLFVGPFVWISIALINVLMIIATIVSYLYYNSRSTAYKTGGSASGAVNVSALSYTFSTNIAFLDTSVATTLQDVNFSLGVFIAFLVVTILIILITIVMIKRIKMAIEIINEASEAFRALPGIQFVPLPFVVAILAVFVYFIIIMLYLYSAKGTVTISLLNMTYNNANNVYYMMWYHLAGFIWTYYTIFGMLQLTIAGSVAEWYWTAKKPAKLTRPALNACYRAFRYSLGSVILGSLLITIVELIRVALYQLQRQVAQSKNIYLKYIVACAQYCMKCLEVLMKWINRNAYVYIAITGKAFFAAAGAATVLLIKNAAKTMAVGYVSDFALFFAKFAVVVLNTLGAYGFMATQSATAFKNPIFNPMLTVVLVAVETYMIVTLFFTNYQLAIDTIFLSALEDLDKNDGTPQRPYYMSDKLQKIMHLHNDPKSPSKAPVI